MSLRARLALLYTSIVGGILFLFGMAVYVAVSASLTSQLDTRLTWTANSVIDSMHAGALGDIQMPELDLFSDVYLQVWNTSGLLEARSQNIQRFTLPLDETGMRSNRPIFQDVQVGTSRLRVLTVPLVPAGSDRIIGTLQVGTSLATVERTQEVLIWVLFIGAGLSMLVAGLAGWISTNQALTPLEAVTETALQITRADDLSRRIPYKGPPGDEVGQLITAFNQSLSRLENLFNTQRRFIADVGH